MDERNDDILSPAFIFVTKPQFDAAGMINDMRIQTANVGVPEEIVLTIIRHWLKSIDREYHRKFMQQL